jgi:nucleotide-binding universal stress UspA family protein
LLAKKLGARMTGFYVGPVYHTELFPDFVPPDLMSPEQHEKSVKRAAERYLGEIKKAAAANKVTCTCYYIISDTPAHAIVQAASKYRCDLIFMGSHGRSGLTKLLLGSQTSKVLSESRIPVLVHR